MSQNNTISDQDDQLVMRLRIGDENAFTYLYDNYAALMLGVLRRIVKEQSDAENLLQECFIKVWQHIDRFDRSKGRLATWLINIARNTAIDYTRSKYYHQKTKNQKLENFVFDNAGYFADGISEDIIGMAQLVDKLSPTSKQVISWIYFEGYTQQEISDEFGLPLGTVKTRVRMGLQELREYYQ